MRLALRGSALVAALAGVVLAGIAALATSALASPIALDAPENGTNAVPLIAYDPATQTTYVAWADPINPAVDLCILVAGATGCEGGAPVLLEDSLFTGANFSGPGGLVVLPGGEVAVIGDTTVNGSIAWISPPGGGAFLTGGRGLQNGGEPISAVSLFYSFGNAVALNSTDVGLLDGYFNHLGDTSLTSPSPEPPANTNPGGKFPRKALETSGPEIAAEPAPAPAPAGSDVVVGVGDNFGGPPEALPGCLNKEGTGYGVSAGNVDGTSKAAGTLNAKGLPAYGVLACSAQAPVLAQGGKSGIGLVEEEGDGFDGTGSLYTVDYRPFIATATGGTFGAPVQLADVSNVSLGGVINLDLSEDSGTGVYATWEDLQGLVLDYSSNGGASWDPPVVVPEPIGGPQGNPVIVGIGGGNAEIAYVDNPGTGDQVFLQAVNYQQLELKPTAISTVQTSGTTTGTSITIPEGTAGETDKATIAGTNAASATGTTTYALYSSASCSGSAVFTSTASVSGGAVASSTPIPSALLSGTYYWRASYSGDSNNQSSASACGSEVLTVAGAASTSLLTIPKQNDSVSSKGNMSVVVECKGAPCSGSLTLIVKVKKTTGKGKKKKTKTVVETIGTVSFSSLALGTDTIALKLNSTGLKLLKHDGYKLKSTASATYLSGKVFEVATGDVALKGHKPKKKKKKKK